MTQRRIPAVFMRGGTSKGLFFRAEDLPAHAPDRDGCLVRALGGGDPFQSQIDGLGGGTSSTSKAVVVQASSRSDADVDYTFGQVGVDQPFVDWTSNCGNLASAVGLFAVEEQWVPPAEGATAVRIWQVNTQRLIVAHVPTEGGRPVPEGDFRIDGVPYAAPEIRLDFVDPGGIATGRLLPTGSVKDVLSTPWDAEVEATLIDAGIPAVVVEGERLGCPAPEDLDDPAVWERLEAVRAAGAVAMGIAGDADKVAHDHQNIPKIVLVWSPRRWRTRSRVRQPEDADVIARLISMGRPHHALSVTGAIVVAAGRALPGSVVDEACRPDSRARIRIGHASGILTADLEAAGTEVQRVTLGRSARRLMDGWVSVPWNLGLPEDRDLLEPQPSGPPC